MSCTRKGLTSTVKPFSYAALGSRRLIVTISGTRNNVALRFTSLTAERRGRTNPLISTTFRTWRMCQVFFCIAHASLRSLIRDLHGKYAEGRHIAHPISSARLLLLFYLPFRIYSTKSKTALCLSTVFVFNSVVYSSK